MNTVLKTTNPVPVNRRICATGALLILAAASSFAAPKVAPTPTPTVAEVVPPPQSVFIDRPDFGRDPFFPKSTRRGAVTPTNPVVEPTANFGNLALKGISVNNERRLAIINNKTFEAGEEGEVRVNGQPVKLTVTEIREKSVVITVNGVSKELFLGPKI